MPYQVARVDVVLAVCMATFAVTAMVFEPYVVFDSDGTALRADALAASPHDYVRALWAWYARSFDPLFLATPLWLRIMCGIDMFVFGPTQAAMTVALLRGWLHTSARWRLAAVLYASAIVYSTAVYFAVEVLQEMGDDSNGATDMLMVVVINIPYTIAPIALGCRAWQLERRALEAAASKRQS